MRIAPRLWALHGQVAYDGEVIAAVFASEHEAWFALFEGAGAALRSARHGGDVCSIA